MTHDLAEVTPAGKLRLHFHPGQMRAWASERRFVCVLAGIQGGKTSFGPYWLYREIQRKGPGDYLVVNPTFPLLIKKALPEFLKLFDRQLDLGKYHTQQKVFTFSRDGQRRTHGVVGDTPTQVFFGHATDPESLESATAKALWADEAGQKKFRLASWEALLRRLSLYQGRALITTTPYDRGWLKQKVYDPWEAKHPDYDVIRFESRMNPVFPAAEWRDAMERLPRWKFNLFYKALFERPAGLIYDAFDQDEHTCPRFAISEKWTRYLGLDFGGVHTAGVFYAREPNTTRFYAYREYLAGGRTAKEHVAALKAGEPMLPIAVGGSHSEGQWRDEFRAAGLPVREPAVKDVEVGIDRVYAAHKTGQIIVFNDLAGYLDEKASYSRPVDDNGEPTEGIEDKESYHRMDAERYIIGWLRRSTPSRLGSSAAGKSVVDQAPDGVWQSGGES